MIPACDEFSPVAGVEVAGFVAPFGCRLSLSDVHQAVSGDGTSWLRVEVAAGGGNQSATVFHLDVDNAVAYKDGQPYAIADPITGEKLGDRRHGGVSESALFINKVFSYDARIAVGDSATPWDGHALFGGDDVESEALRIGMGAVRFVQESYSLAAAAEEKSLHAWMVELLRNVTAGIELCIADIGFTYPPRNLRYESTNPHEVESYMGTAGYFYDDYDPALFGQVDGNTDTVRTMYLSVVADGRQLRQIDAQGALWADDLGERLVPYSAGHPGAAVWGSDYTEMVELNANGYFAALHVTGTNVVFPLHADDMLDVTIDHDGAAFSIELTDVVRTYQQRWTALNEMRRFAGLNQLREFSSQELDEYENLIDEQMKAL